MVKITLPLTIYDLIWEHKITMIKYLNDVDKVRIVRSSLSII
jgi:hypothetical protein